MPKLNLDLFGQTASASDSDTNQEENVRKSSDSSLQTPESKLTRPREQTLPRATEKSLERQSVRFVPVGFNIDSLLALDDAVLALRRQGHWKASKSGIIRALIRRHQADLAAVYLGDGTREP